MKRKPILFWLAVLLGCVVGGTAAVSKSFAPPPSAKTVAGASSQDLAISYDGVRQLYSMLPFVESGMTIHTPEGEVNSGNVAKVRNNIELRLAVYRNEIETRGFIDFAGTYRMSVTPSCARTNSWLTLTTSSSADTVVVTQRSFEFKLIHRVPYQGRETENDMDGIIVENKLSFRDFANSDFVFTGTIDDGKILIRADTDAVLASWPSWANPPKRKDLNSCVVTLTRR